MQNNDISKLNDIHDLDELESIREAHHKEAEAINQAEARIQQEMGDKRHQQDQMFKRNLTEDIWETVSMKFSSCDMIVNRAWDIYHLYGTQEVTSAAYELASFIEKILKNEHQHQ